jgi:hypothetical protein
MNEAITIIQTDLRAYSGFGHSVQTYTDDHVLSALIEADVDPASIALPPGTLLSLAILDLCWKALEQ